MQMFKSFEQHIDTWRCKCLNHLFKSIEHIDTWRCKCLNHLNTLIPVEMQMFAKNHLNTLFKSFLYLEMQMFKSFEHIDTWRCKCLNRLTALIPGDAKV